MTAEPGRGGVWLRRSLLGLLWAAFYNGIWAAAWFGFMRAEWTDTAAAMAEPMPWTPDFWMVWVPLTIPFGVAIAAYLDDEARRPRAVRSSVSAGIVLWVPGTIGMAIWAALSIRIIVIDSVVNLAAVLLACLALGALVQNGGIVGSLTTES